MDIRKLKVGDRLRNNDPRIPDGDPRKVVTVTSTLGNSYVVYEASTRTARITVTRIFDDGKKRSQGYNLVNDAAARVAVEDVDPVEIDRMADDGAPVPEKELKFRPSIRVRVKAHYYPHAFSGVEGVLIATHPTTKALWAIHFPDRRGAAFEGGLHHCARKVPDGRGRWIYEDDFEIVQ